ncbi:translation elongation factor Ts [Patescibacteria group bacterium]|nr:translation elongation factor Ts [Patescibacteria group bacterium]
MVNLKLVQKLRQTSGVGILDCQKAIKESKGDLEKAFEILRKKGIAKAAKRDSRKTSVGIIKFFVTQDNQEGYIVSVNSETDFAAQSERFQKFSENILVFIKKEKPQNLEELNKKFKDEIDNVEGVIGERIEIGNYGVLKGDLITGYSHMDGKIGVLVSLDFEGDIKAYKDELNKLAHEIALQITALNPGWISEKEVPQEVIKKEKQIYQANIDKNKPSQIVEKILQGQIQKFYKENCLLLQAFIKDDSLTIQDLIQQKINKIGKNIQVKKFIRFSL